MPQQLRTRSPPDMGQATIMYYRNSKLKCHLKVPTVFRSRARGSRQASPAGCAEAGCARGAVPGTVPLEEQRMQAAAAGPTAWGPQPAPAGQPTPPAHQQQLSASDCVNLVGQPYCCACGPRPRLSRSPAQITLSGTYLSWPAGFGHSCSWFRAQCSQAAR